MGSEARRAFEENKADVERLPEIHGYVGGTGRGRKYGVEVLNKSAIVLITSAWEAFKSWFVDFDPVRAKAEGRPPAGMDVETAKLFPSKFVDSDLGPVPAGWQRLSVGSCGRTLGCRG